MNQNSSTPSPAPMPTPMSDERKFLHDLASPLATALFLIDIAIEDAGSAALSGTANLEIAESLRKTLGALEKMKALLHIRRTQLITQAQAQSGEAA